MATLGFYSYSIAAVAFLMLAVLLATGWQGRSQGIRLIVACAVTSAWAGLLAVTAVIGEVSAYPVAIAECLRDGAWIFVLSGLAASAGVAATLSRVLNLGWVAAAIYLLLAPYVSRAGFPIFVPGVALVATGFALALGGLMLLEQVYRNARGEGRFALKYLASNGFYDAMEPVVLDRIVGGTGYLYCTTAPDGSTRFSCASLSDTRHSEDVHGAPLIVVNKKQYTPRAVSDEWGDKVPDGLLSKDPTVPSLEVLRVDNRTADGAWEQWTILKQGCCVLEYRTEKHPRFYPTRWSRVPNWPYGRGPALLSLSDIRAINKLKELTLLNAAKAVAGVYTGVDDGVMNPYTVSFAAGAIIPVASNDPNNPTLRALDNPARFDIAQFSIDNLRESIKAQFLSDQFGPLSRTPRSATEVSARGGIIARRLGLTLLRLREEVVEPIIQRVLDEGHRQGLIPEVRIDGAVVSITYSGELASAQRDADAGELLNFTTVAQQFGQVDPLAALVVDVPSALRRYAELKGIPSAVMRSERQAQQLADQMAQNQQMAAAQAGGQTAAIGAPA